MMTTCARWKASLSKGMSIQLEKTMNNVYLLMMESKSKESRSVMLHGAYDYIELAMAGAERAKRAYLESWKRHACLKDREATFVIYRVFVSGDGPRGQEDFVDYGSREFTARMNGSMKKPLSWTAHNGGRCLGFELLNK